MVGQKGCEVEQKFQLAGMEPTNFPSSATMQTNEQWRPYDNFLNKYWVTFYYTKISYQRPKYKLSKNNKKNFYSKNL